MTPEEILNDLRDIHLPDATAETPVAGLVYWPVLLVAALTLAALAVVWRRRSAWRRDIICELDAIEEDASTGRVREGWTALATLLRRIAIGFTGRDQVAGLVGEAWLERLDDLFQTDVFSHGPGRGLISVPYGAGPSPEGDANEASELRATVGDVRRHLTALRRARWSS